MKKIKGKIRKASNAWIVNVLAKSAWYTHCYNTPTS